MGKYIILCFLFLLFSGNAQIITNEDHEETVSKDNSADLVSEFYLGIAPTYTYRVLTENEGLFGGEIGDKINEKGVVISSFNFGSRNSISQKMLFDFGIGISRNRETYSIDFSDSLYEYTNTYRHISFPVKLVFSTGNIFNFYGGLGFTPKAFISRKKELRYKGPVGLEQNETIFEQDGFNFFLIDVAASIGLRINTDDNYGFFTLLEAAYQLNSNFDNQSPLHRNPYGVGVHFGLYFSFD